MIQEKTKSESILNDVISEIQSISEGGKWFLSSSRLTELLEIRKEIFYRLAYSTKNSLLNYDVLKGFHEADCEVLCRFLANFLGLEDVESAFQRGGIYFSKSALDEISDYFVRYLIASIENHKLDKELIMLLASATLNFDDAFDSYLDDKFDREVMIGRYVGYYTEIRHIDTSYGAETFLKKFLFTLFSERKIDFQKITRETKHRAYYELYGREIHFSAHSNETLLLLKFFQLDENSTRAELRKRYKELLKKYHPDLNKSGLEKTKEIIEKYKKLSTLLK